MFPLKLKQQEQTILKAINSFRVFFCLKIALLTWYKPQLRNSANNCVELQKQKAGFELRISSIGSNRSSNCALSTAICCTRKSYFIGQLYALYTYGFNINPLVFIYWKQQSILSLRRLKKLTIHLMTSMKVALDLSSKTF